MINLFQSEKISQLEKEKKELEEITRNQAKFQDNTDAFVKVSFVVNTEHLSPLEKFNHKMFNYDLI